MIDLSQEPNVRYFGYRMHPVDGFETCCEPFDAGMLETGTKPHLVQNGAMSEYVHVRKRGNVRVMLFARSNGSSVSTTIDTLDKGKVPILFSIQQMRNLEFELAHTAAGEFLTCQKFGLKNFPLSVSTSDHTALNVLDLARASRTPSHRFAAITCPACNGKYRPHTYDKNCKKNCRTTGQASKSSVEVPPVRHTIKMKPRTSGDDKVRSSRHGLPP